MGPDTLTMDAANPSRRFRDLLERHRKIVFKVANAYCRDPDDRADLAQEIAMQLWRSFPAYDGERAFSTWMYRVALNVAISFQRSSRRHDRDTVGFDEALHDAASDGAVAEIEDHVRALHRCIDALDPLNRALLLLYLEEKSYREIADILGVSETNVATKISRLKQRIRADMADDAANR